MKMLRVTGRSPSFASRWLDCAELFHDTFHYNVKEAKALASAIVRGEEVVVPLPIDCTPEEVLETLARLGAEGLVEEK